MHKNLNLKIETFILENELFYRFNNFYIFLLLKMEIFFLFLNFILIILI